MHQNTAIIEKTLSNGETCLSKESELLSKFMSPLTPPPPPNFLRIRGPLLVYLNPPILWKMYPLDLGNWLVTIALKKCIIGLSREIFSRQTPQIKVPLPPPPPKKKKMGTRMLPLSVFEGADFS